MPAIDTTSQRRIASARNIATRDDLKAISGLKRPSATRDYLVRHGIPHIVGADSWPRVLCMLCSRIG